MVDSKLVTWGDMDIEAVENAFNKIRPLIEGEYPDSKTRVKLKKLMEAFLPEYDIKCDEENNPPEVMDSGNIVVKISTKKLPNQTYSYIDVIF